MGGTQTSRANEQTRIGVHLIDGFLIGSALAAACHRVHTEGRAGVSGVASGRKEGELPTFVIIN